MNEKYRKFVMSFQFKHKPIPPSEAIPLMMWEQEHAADWEYFYRLTAKRINKVVYLTEN